MKSKSKTSAKGGPASGGKNSVSRKTKQSKYSVYYLAVVLACLLLLEGFLFNASTGADWKKAVTVLDMSSGVAEVTSDLAIVMQPVIDTVLSVDLFYQQSATAMTQLLDLSSTDFGSEILQVVDGVNSFFVASSVEMAQALDVSGVSPWPSMVAGISIEK